MITKFTVDRKSNVGLVLTARNFHGGLIIKFLPRSLHTSSSEFKAGDGDRKINSGSKDKFELSAVTLTLVGWDSETDVSSTGPENAERETERESTGKESQPGMQSHKFG